MQILHRFTGSVQQYLEQLTDPDQHRPAHCPQCQAKRPLTARGYYTRTIIDAAFDGLIPVRRYLYEVCPLGRTVGGGEKGYQFGGRDGARCGVTRWAQE